MYRLVIITMFIALLCDGNSLHSLHASPPDTSLQNPATLQDIETLIERYGKKSIIRFILEKGAGQITLHIGNRTKLFYGAPNPAYVNAHTIHMDLNRIGSTLPAVNKALSSAQQVHATKAITPAARPLQTMRPPPHQKQHTLGLSYHQMMNYLSNVFTMEFSPLADGRPRYVGQSDKGLALLEIIGDKSDISSTFLMIGLPNDALDVVAQNTAVLLRFLRNVIPEWPESDTWVTNTIQTMVAQSNDQESTTYGHKKIEIKRLSALSTISVSVTPSI